MTGPKPAQLQERPRGVGRLAGQALGVGQLAVRLGKLLAQLDEAGQPV